MLERVQVQLRACVALLHVDASLPEALFLLVEQDALARGIG